MDYESLDDLALNRRAAERLQSKTYLMFIPSYCDHPDDVMPLVRDAAERGFWLQISSPFSPRDADPEWGKKWHAGFTPHGTSGWNGRPDHMGHADKMGRAVVVAYLVLRDAIDNGKGK